MIANDLLAQLLVALRGKYGVTVNDQVFAAAFQQQPQYLRWSVSSPTSTLSRKSMTAAKPQLVWTKLVADLETPVSAYLKLADGRPNSFLLESVEGGSVRGRYSIIGFKPDVIWRCTKSKVEINRRARTDARAFEPVEGRPLETLRTLIPANARWSCPTACRRWRPACSAFWATTWSATWSGCPTITPITIGLPDAIMVRPTLICIFDRLEDQVTSGHAGLAAGRHQRARRLLKRRRSGWRRGVGLRAYPALPAAKAPTRWTTCPNRRPTCRRTTSRRWSRPARSTSAQATPSRSCPRSASRCPSSCRRFRSTARCAASTLRRS